MPKRTDYPADTNGENEFLLDLWSWFYGQALAGGASSSDARHRADFGLDGRHERAGGDT